MAKFFKAYRTEGYRCDIVSVNQKGAKDTITYVRNFWESLPPRWKHPLTIDNAFSIGFHEGRRRSVINSIAASAGVRGGKKDVVFDEAAHIQLFPTLFVAALPATARGGGGFDVVSTPMGNQGKFAEIWHNADGKQYSNWSRHGFLWFDVTAFCKDIHRAREVWEKELGQNMAFMEQLFDEFATNDLKDLVLSLTQEEFHQEFCGVFVDESTAFYPWALINQCRKQTEPVEGMTDYVEPWFAKPEGNDHEVFMGIDFAEGKKGGDSTSVQVIEKTGDKRLMHRFFADLDHKSGHDDFDRQIAEINRYIDKFRPSRVSLDETGLGRKIAADLKKIHGSVIDPVTFHNANKEKMALDLKGLLETERLWLQYENKRLAGQIHNIKRKITSSGNIQYSGEPHDDMFWALALACKGEERRGGFRIITLN